MADATGPRLTGNLTGLQRAALGVYHLLFLPVGAVLLMAGAAYLLWLPEALASVSPIFWLLAAPFLYFTWLLLVLACGALEMRLLGLAGVAKARRVRSNDPGFAQYLMVVTFGCYVRAHFVWSLPMARSLLALPYLRWLVLCSYASRCRLGRESIVFGYLYDPDLTEVGDGAMIGADSVISCHNVNATPDGAFIYTSAPVVIGTRAVVGGNARIALGVRIGADAVVEPGSTVVPFTVIGPGEVWGGAPAVLLRRRFNPPASASDKDACRVEANREEAVRRMVADALDLPLAEVHDNLAAGEGGWDSLGQMALAAAVHTRFGVHIPAAEVFRLRNLDDIRRLVGEGPGTNAKAASHEPLPVNPELLPLLDHGQTTCALAARNQKINHTLNGDELSVVVAATFTAEPLAGALKLWARAFGVPVGVEFAGFNQVVHALLAADGPFRRNRTGLNVVLARPEDLLPGEEAADGLLDAIAAFARDPAGLLVVATLPPAVSAVTPVDRQAADDLRVRWRRRLTECGVELLDFSVIVEELGTASSGQTDLEVVARAPYAPRVYEELGVALARLARRGRAPQAKVLALDADGVLWGGVVAEDGPAGVHLGPEHPGRAFQLFQQRVVELQRRGVLVVLVSRNDEQDVWKIFDSHPGMVLRRSDVTAARINWRPKSENLRELAAELNLGLDAFVFLDDDPAVRLEVEANAPGVTVVPLPRDPALYGPTLDRLWCFDAAATTSEDRGRVHMMQQERERRNGREAASDLATYLQSLRLRGRMRPAQERDLPRVAQLTQKTNQFNLSLRRRGVADLKALGPRYAVHVIEASDRFGDYGLIGVCILAAAEDGSGVYELDTFLMSCRALGRGLEDAALHELLGVARAGGGRRLHAPFVAGPRNQPVRAFLERSGFQAEGEALVIETAAGNGLPEHIAWEGSETPPLLRVGA